MRFNNPTSVELTFGKVATPMHIREGEFTSIVDFGIRDAVNLIGQLRHYYMFKSKPTKRQREISDLCNLLREKLQQEKKLEGTLFIPFKK